MKKLLLTLSLFGVLAASAQVPQLINYQGRVTASGTNFTGTGHFKFALVNAAGTINYWSHDGTATGEPATSVSLPVAVGICSVLLGDPTIAGMTTAISPTVFVNPDVRLRIWFTDGSGAFQQLAPDQRIAAVGYALVAASVPDGTITATKLAPGAVTAGKLDTTGASTGQTLTYNGTTTGWVTPADPALSNKVFSGSSTFSGANSFTHPANVFAGAFTGNGGALTNLSVSAANITGTLADARLSSNVPLLNSSPTFIGGVTASGFTGNGSGLISLPAANLTGSVPDTRLSANVALLNNSNTYSGAFVGNGAGLTNLAVPTGNLVGTLATGQIPSLDAGKITTGTFTTAQIPNLDASKLTSGTLGDARLSGNVALLTGSPTFSGAVAASSFTGSGSGLTSLPAANLTGSVADARLSTNIPRLNTSNTYNGSFVGNGAGLTNLAVPVGNLVGTLATAQIPSLDAGKITIGTFTTGQIPSLDAAKVTTGTFTTAQIPNLDASKLTSGTLGDARLSGNVALLTGSPTFSGAVAASSFTGSGSGLTSLPAANLTGSVADARLSANVALLNTSNTYTGSFVGNGVGLTNLAVPTGNLVGTLAAGQIPSLDATKIATGTFTTGQIPSLDAAKIATGTFTATQIPGLDASKLTSGTVSDARLSSNVPLLAGSPTFTGAVTASSFTGSGNGLTSLSAANLTGSVADARLSTNVPLLNTSNTYTGSFIGNGAGLTNLAVPVGNLVGTLATGQIPSLDAGKITTGTFTTGQIPNLDAAKIATGTFTTAQIPGLDASKLTSGTVSDARLSGNVPLLASSPTFSGAVTASSFTGSGSGLTSLPAANLTGSVADARLSANVALLNTSNTYSGSFVGNGASLTNLPATSLTGTIGSAQIATSAVTPAKLDTSSATSGQVLTYNGSSAAWATPSGSSTYSAGTGLSLAGTIFSLATSGVTSTHLASGAVGAAQLAASAVTLPKLDTSSAASGQVLTYNGTSATWATPATATTYSPGSGLSLAGTTFSIASGGVTATHIASGAVDSSQLAANAVSTTKLAANAVGSSQLATAAVGSNQLDLTALATVLWKAGGNAGTTAGTHFLGTTDNTALQLHVNGGRAQRFEPNTNGAPNVIGGSPLNSVASGVAGAFIGGGGAVNYLGSAFTNTVSASFGTVVGGARNIIDTTGLFGSIGGGYDNEVSGNSATIGGGYFNLASGLESVVGGGQANTASGSVSFVGGGTTNYATGFESAVVGGEYNAATGTNAFVGAGYNNGAADFAALVGGYANYASGKFSFVGGGLTNYATGFESAVAGGALNAATATNSFIGGGYYNGATNAGATVGGGSYNLAGGAISTVGGGYYNGASGYGATIPGGYANSASGSNSLAAGYLANAAHAGSFVFSDMSSATYFSSTVANQFTVRAAGGVRLVVGSTTNTLLSGGAGWSIPSDRNVKKDFAPVDGREVLRKLDAVPVQSWRYKWDDADSTPHLGPVAQEFKAAFFPGRDDKSISTLEFDGVELAAIQGLHTLMKEKDAKISALEQRLADIETKLKQFLK